MIILVINSGSSSLKYQVRDTETGERLAEGTVERIGDSTHGGPIDHQEALDRVTDDVEQALQGKAIDAVGHRVVHGGERFSEPVLVDNEITRSIERLSPLAPLHNPANVQGIRAITTRWPDMPQVAVFDTAFHRTLPEQAWRYAVPDELYTRFGIRRYGFHGTSIGYVTHHAASLLGLAPSEFTGIIAHLGNGASITAVQAGASIDTSMGFTPLEGLVMGTRSGDIDPSILLFLSREGYSAEDLDQLLNRESGLLGLTGQNDMRSVVESAAGGDARAELALDLASYRLAKYIGGYHVAVGGAQALVFTAGIGENSWQFRERVVGRLGALNLHLDDAENRKKSSAPRQISTEDSAFPVLVVPTDEEAAIAEATAVVVGR
ncbi:acetate kinase [Arthrobacter flavus]|uniref:Acetate kinase n=1 Tax=Arthrobacter flavus TaxID=95172 RepID=A0ABW4Q5I9_9MICC